MPVSTAPNGRKFRAACDPCHIRKVKCKISPLATACEDCVSDDRACFFTLCRRAGRPRAALTAPASSAAQPSTGASLISIAPPDVQDLSPSDTGLSMDWLSLAEPASFEKASNHLPSFAMDMEQAVEDMSTFSESPSQYKNDGGIFNVGLLEYDGSKETLFSTILRTSIDLQSILEASHPLQLELWGSESFILGLLQSETPRLDHAGRELCDTLTVASFGSSAWEPSETAILSLLMAGSFKLLEICSVWTDNICSIALHINHTLLLRRIDGNLVQIRTLLTQLQAMDNTPEDIIQDGLRTSAQLHRRIDDVIKKGWENLA